MSQVVVVSFESEGDARSALASLRGLEQAGQIAFEDTAIVVHRSDLEYEVKNEVSGTTEAGAVVGALLGGLLFVMFPIAGIALGAAAGAGVGAALGKGVDGKFVEGHVPVAQIHALLKRPALRGIAVPGMPAGSPGMDYGQPHQAYQVLGLNRAGQDEVLASYPAPKVPRR